MHASGSRWRLLLVLLAALALACRGEVDPITGQQSPSTGFPNYEPVPKTASQRRDKMSGRSQAQKISTNRAWEIPTGGRTSAYGLNKECRLS